jgi:hypothetical protein
VVLGLVVLNVFTGLTNNIRTGSTYPGYPSILFAYDAGNITILIHGALGPYLYNNITVKGVYNTSSNITLNLVKYANDAYYLGLKVHAAYMFIRASAIDSSQNTEYYYNASIKVNASAPGSIETNVVSGGILHVLVIGLSPYVGVMEGKKIA